MKLVELYSNLKDKIVDDIVKENFQYIFNKYKKGNNSNKEVIEEIEKKFFAGEKFMITKQSRGAGGVKKEKKKVGIKRTYSKMKNEDETDSIVSEQNNINSNSGGNNNNNNGSNNVQSQPVNKRNTRQVKNRKKIVDDSDNDGNDNDSEY
jgi:hypothetical protein